MKEVISTECVVIGGGIIGLAIGSELARNGKKIILLEKEDYLCQHTSSRNSEVIHSGIYYKPDSLKASLCKEGNELLYQYCNEKGIRHNPIGKMIIGDENSEEYLQQLINNGKRNNVKGLNFLTEKTINKYEPNVSAKFAVLSNTTGVIDSHEFSLSLENEIEQAGGYISKRSVIGDIKNSDGWEITIKDDYPFLIKSEILINASGLNSYELAKNLGLRDIPRARFFIGHYFKYYGQNPFTRLIYPIPDKSGLGIHSTSDLDGNLRFGPDAEEISKINYDFINEVKRKKIFTSSIKKYFPNLSSDKLKPDYTGIRIRLGETHYESDFYIKRETGVGLDNLINLIGIESPGLTASLAIGRYVSKLI
jgi:L-2-hydroxyglutarate oxidase LhgO